ncbi:Os02g0214766, partial [Oryza sativa Japonica Group]
MPPQLHLHDGYQYQYTELALEELEDGEDDVVDVAEAGGLGLLGVVQPAGPVDGDVVGAVVELDGGADGGPRVGLAVGVEAVEDGAVRADVEAAEGADLAELGLRGDGAEEGDVVVGVEAAEVDAAGGERAEHLHLGRGEEAVVGEQRVGHPHPVGLHRVALTVVVVAHLRVVEVAHPPLLRVAARRRRQRVAARARRRGVHR